MVMIQTGTRRRGDTPVAPTMKSGPKLWLWRDIHVARSGRLSCIIEPGSKPNPRDARPRVSTNKLCPPLFPSWPDPNLRLSNGLMNIAAPLIKNSDNAIVGGTSGIISSTIPQIGPGHIHGIVDLVGVQNFEPLRNFAPLRNFEPQRRQNKYQKNPSNPLAP